MTVEKISAFISSTSDLRTEREAVREVCAMLKVEPFLYEEVPANSASPESFLREVIGASEIYVGLLGGRYGSFYPPQNERSIVEFEFDEACNRHGLHLTAVFPKVLPPENVEPLQEKFRKKVGGFGNEGVWIRTFDSIERLKTEVRDSITFWLGDVFIKYKRGEEPGAARDHRRVKGIAGILAGIGALTSLVFALLPFSITSRTVAIAIGCLAVGILLCIVVAEYLL
jgi:hypothetical protein